MSEEKVLYSDAKNTSEESLEAEIQKRNLNAPRLTPEKIDQTVAYSEYHVFPSSQTTVCMITLKNGFTVIGESACVSPKNFDEEIGRKVAFENARNKIWLLEGYRLKQELYEESMMEPAFI